MTCEDALDENMTCKDALDENMTCKDTVCGCIYSRWKMILCTCIDTVFYTVYSLGEKTIYLYMLQMKR